MKKILLAAALCAGIVAFANADFAEAAEQQTPDVTSITQSTTGDTQQLSTRVRHDDDD